MNDTSIVARVGQPAGAQARRREHLRGESPRVRPLHHPHPGVRPQLPRERPVADVHRDHFPRSPLQQAVGEPTGRGPHVKGTPAVHLESRSGEPVRQLDPPTRDELGTLSRPSAARLSRSALPAWTARRPPAPTHTSPAITAAAALLRDGNTPRSASRVSRRLLGPAIAAEPLHTGAPDAVTQTSGALAQGGSRPELPFSKWLSPSGRRTHDADSTPHDRSSTSPVSHCSVINITHRCTGRGHHG